MWPCRCSTTSWWTTCARFGCRRAAVFESARRMARWHYQWMVIHEFLPAIVGQAMTDSVYKEVPTGAPIINIKYYKPTNPRGAPSSRSSSRWPRIASGTASPDPATPFRTTSTAPAPVAVSSVPLFEAPAHRQQLERVPPSSASAEDPVEQVLQRGGAAPHRPARAPVRRIAGRRAVHAADDGAARLQPARACCRSAEPPPGQEDGPALRTAGGSADGRDAAHQRPAVAEPPHRGEDPHPHHRPRCNVVEVLREFDVENRDLKTALRRSGMERRGPAVVLHLEGGRAIGRASRQGPASSARSAGASWPRSSSVCCRRTSTRICICSPLEARATHRAGPRASSPWPISSSTRGVWS